MKNRIQLTTDGHKVYLNAVDNAFGSEVDFSQLIKLYGNEVEREVRYNPAQCTGTRKARITGKPDPKYVSTSYVERQNLTIAYDNETLYKTYKCLLKEDRELSSCSSIAFYEL